MERPMGQQKPAAAPREQKTPPRRDDFSVTGSLLVQLEGLAIDESSEEQRAHVEQPSAQQGSRLAYLYHQVRVQSQRPRRRLQKTQS